LEADVKLLANPLILRMGMVLFAAAFAFAIGVVLMRRMRKSLKQDESLVESPDSAESLPLHTYNAVIQQLKQQKHELTSAQQSERRRAKTSESISGVVLANLASGVLLFNSQGLVRQNNLAAKNILGYASLVGMSALEIFRSTSARIPGSESNFVTVAGAIRSALRDRVSLRRVHVEYVTPSMEEKVLEITISAVPDSESNLLGAVCLIADLTSISQMRHQQDLHGEMSAEMALTLKSSLDTIRGCAQRLVENRDLEMARQLTSEIEAEAAHLERTIGGFLAEATAAKAGV
jgi:nitrogen fixation/metabolism regulation signal transduction histidine kinase